MKNFKRFLVSLLALLLVATMLPITAMAATSPADSGWTEIKDVAGFCAMTDGNYYLANDIDFSEVDAAFLVEEFSGNLDGRNFAITGFKGSVFKEIAGTANTTVRNLKIGGEGSAVIKAEGVSGNFGFLANTHAGAGFYALVIESVDVWGEATATGDGVVLGGLVGNSREISVIDCSFTGKLSGGAIVGGMVGHLDRATDVDCRRAAIKSCEVNATLDGATVGGMIGRCEFTTLVDDCKHAGAYTATSCVGGIVGEINATEDRSTGLMVFAATDCSGTSTLSEIANKGDVYGSKAEARVYVRGCSATQDTKSHNIDEELPADYDKAKNNYVLLLNSEDDFKKIGGENFPLTGFYRLANSIKMADDTYNAPVVTGVFCGIFDGAGFAITNLQMNSTATGATNMAGFFERLSGKSTYEDSMLLDCNFGTADSKVGFTSSAGATGVLAGTCGVGSVHLNNVKVYADVHFNGGNSQWIGGFLGVVRTTSFYDCDMYGSVTREGTVSRGVLLGGIIGTTRDTTISPIFYNCNNRADVVADNSSATKGFYLGGIVGQANSNGTTNIVFLNCNNFGTVNAQNDGTANACAGGLLGGDLAASAKNNILNCVNFGNVSSKKFAGGCIGSLVEGNISNIDSFGQFGAVSGTDVSDCANGGTVNTFNCQAETAINMFDGAAVRISSDNTGIRFKATVSEVAIERLRELYGKDATVSYGILISPSKFITGAGDKFTHEALDQYAVDQHFGVNEKAYVDVVANEGWFDDQTGVIAGSIIGVKNTLYNTEFGGVAYIKVTVGNEIVCAIYASNAQTKTISGVAKKALADVKAESVTEGGFTYDKQLEVGETYYDGTGAAKTVEQGTVLYSCYTKTQRDALNKILADVPAQ